MAVESAKFSWDSLRTSCKSDYLAKPPNSALLLAFLNLLFLLWKINPIWINLTVFALLHSLFTSTTIFISIFYLRHGINNHHIKVNAQVNCRATKGNSGWLISYSSSYFYLFIFFCPFPRLCLHSPYEFNFVCLFLLSLNFPIFFQLLSTSPNFLQYSFY